jgi:hypothetical protein
MFLLEYVPSVLDELRGSLALITVEGECEQLKPIQARDDLSIRMHARDRALTELTLAFEYVRFGHDGPEFVAKGSHTVASMTGIGGTFTPTWMPEQLRTALREFAETDAFAIPNHAGSGGRALARSIPALNAPEKEKLCHCHRRSLHRSGHCRFVPCRRRR